MITAVYSKNVLLTDTGATTTSKKAQGESEATRLELNHGGPSFSRSIVIHSSNVLAVRSTGYHSRNETKHYN